MPATTGRPQAPRPGALLTTAALTASLLLIGCSSAGRRRPLPPRRPMRCPALSGPRPGTGPEAKTFVHGDQRRCLIGVILDGAQALA